MKKDKWEDVNHHKYKKIHEENYSNSVFSTETIELGKEDNYELKTDFTKPEPVYARCYFPEPVGKVEGKNFWHEIWINGKFIKRTQFEKPPDPEWDEIQIWVSEDEYKQEIADLGSGKHEIIIWVIKNEFKGKEVVTETTLSGDIKGKEKEIWVPKRLSKGKFFYNLL